MVDALATCPLSGGLDKQTILDAIITREKQQSTGLGSGLALPHARIAGLKKPAVAIAVLKNAIDFESIDSKPVNVICMVITPQQDPTVALKVMSCISKLMSEETNRSSLLEAKSPQQIINYIKSRKITLDIPITAKDIMQQPAFRITADTPLKQTTALMSRYGTNATAVCDEQNKIVGEITCDLLFHFGIPDFFSQLKSVSFINEFDPFEKYFQEEINATAGNIMQQDFICFDTEATLLEIVFELTVKKHHKVYITQNDELIGEISQISVLDRIINF